MAGAQCSELMWAARRLRGCDKVFVVIERGAEGTLDSAYALTERSKNEQEQTKKSKRSKLKKQNTEYATMENV